MKTVLFYLFRFIFKPILVSISFLGWKFNYHGDIVGILHKLGLLQYMFDNKHKFTNRQAWNHFASQWEVFFMMICNIDPGKLRVVNKNEEVLKELIDSDRSKLVIFTHTVGHGIPFGSYISKEYNKKFKIHAEAYEGDDEFGAVIRKFYKETCNGDMLDIQDTMSKKELLRTIKNHDPETLCTMSCDAAGLKNVYYPDELIDLHNFHFPDPDDDKVIFSSIASRIIMSSKCIVCMGVARPIIGGYELTYIKIDSNDFESPEEVSAYMYNELKKYSDKYNSNDLRFYYDN